MKTLGKRILLFSKWLFSFNGLLFTLIVGILIAITSFFIQDSIQRQRYLELLQFELRSNFVFAGGEIKNVSNQKYIYFHAPISTSVYFSGLQQGYILTLDPKIQAELFSLYNIYIPGMNDLQDRYMNIINDYEKVWENCEDKSIALGIKVDQCNTEKEQYIQIQKQYSIYIAQDDIQLQNYLSEANKTFNPTEERLHPKSLMGFILRLIMGNQSLKIQQ